MKITLDYKMKQHNADDPVRFTGRVVVADPCYFPQLKDDWGNFCDQLFEDDILNRAQPTVFELNDYTCVVASTAFGDGGYEHTGRKKIQSECDYLGVDAGMLAIIPREAITELPTSFAIYEVDGTFDYHNGNFRINDGQDFEVITDGSDYQSPPIL